MNTYEITSDKQAIVITDTEGIKTLVPVAELTTRRQAVEDSKALNIQTFDTQLSEIDRQIAFVSENI